MSTWVEEFHDFAGNNSNSGQFGAMVTGGTMKSTFVPKKPSRKETLEAELKLLEWHKLANDAALKAALMQTKEIHEPTTHHSSHPKDPSLDDDAKRIRKIITNEQTKPLEVSRDFILNYEKKEALDSEKLANQVERHIETLRTIRSKLEDRLELKSRINEYRDWKKNFHDKKLAIMNGKTLQALSESEFGQSGVGVGGNGRSGSGSGHGVGSPGKNKSHHGITNKSHSTTAAGTGTGGGRDLAVVLDSLNKLAQLEARITSLEKDNENIYEKMKNNEEVTQLEAEKTALEFKKKRAVDPLQKGAMKTVYTLRTKKVPISKGVKIPKGGTFLTAVDRDTNNLRDARNREKQRQLALATSGQKNLHERVRLKKTRQLNEINSHRKHEEALQDLSQRRREQKTRIQAKQQQQQHQYSGAAGGKRFKNKYLNEFHKIKNEHMKQREGYGGEKKKNNYLSSQTAPSVVQTSVSHSHSHRPSPPLVGGSGPQNGNRGVPRRPPPTTKTAGTVTRRVGNNSMPTRRQYEGSNGTGGGTGTVMPPIVGSGVGGIRALRDQRGGKR